MKRDINKSKGKRLININEVSKPEIGKYKLINNKWVFFQKKV